MSIHPTAIIAADAEIHPSVTIGPYSIIEAGVQLGEGCVIDSHVLISGAAQLGPGNRVCHGATLGTEPQDIGFRPEHSKPLIIGAHNHFKECVNISRGIKTDAGTRIGDHNYLMAFSHIGHDCLVGNHNTLANTATLAGHVSLGDGNFLAGHVAVHQFCRIGDLCMIGGITGVAQDIPPFALANGQRARILGLNTVGLRRAGFDSKARGHIKAVYRLLFRSGLRLSQAMEEAAAAYPGAETERILAFIRAGDSGRGIAAFGGERKP
ncbi:acyl-ACP--UDP-N-acetylglucosamine O-acyltransferase [Thiorhodovibrio frisius]|uniref:Acyl-(Acyl-carrier-protein)--UDP-N-acetylglucosamine O-acyltransferase n=1 Tax=Thiorhodovibrio frisius TaxID=631362 RepID=H8YYG5_9GAMM|nr:acyl-ACP--UDP-N-acetylglucosamine O-acyltransferase [Thiorhodovibrio frisius]EIC23491.1 acyl-(acyl-carrier-protein)--UDP-N-acetylglucosamine O-acyltransferase [Thiorhodovibrio frisius]WPL23422.1 Acyl-[acyl-carrier-protein]--UDP-N-acetylglucosamine O-acyltransferase [Thiorhodovibrio frisius]